MPVAPGRMELWRRLILLAALLIGVAMFFYVAPAMLSVTAINWEKEQANELKSASVYISSEHKRLGQLTLNDYINEKTEGKVAAVEPRQWASFFEQVQLASNGEYAKSTYGNRVSEEDKDDFWTPQRPVPVFFKPGELPFEQWGLIAEEGRQIYISRSDGEKINYLLLRYEDYRSSMTAMSKPYRVAPDWLSRPYRLVGLGIMAAGVLLYIFLPWRKINPEDIVYAGGRLVAGDIVAVIILLLFYGLPYFINGGTIQSITGLWPISLIMWLLALFGVVILYYSAWYASYRIEMTPSVLYLLTLRGVREVKLNEIEAVEMVSLRNPGWFRKLFILLALFSIAGGRSSPQPAGSALLAASASYGGLEISGRSGKPLYIWFTDQMGGTTIKNFERVTDGLRKAGIKIKQEGREIEGFSMFM